MSKRLRLGYCLRPRVARPVRLALPARSRDYGDARSGGLWELFPPLRSRLCRTRVDRLHLLRLRPIDRQCHGLLPSPDRADQVQRGAHIGGDARIVAGLEQFAAHQVGAHTDATYTGAEPALERGFGSLHASGGHDGDPRARTLDGLHKGGAAHFLAGEHFDVLAAELLRLRDLRCAAASGGVGNLATVADARDVARFPTPPD